MLVQVLQHWWLLRLLLVVALATPLAVAALLLRRPRAPGAFAASHRNVAPRKGETLTEACKLGPCRLSTAES